MAVELDNLKSIRQNLGKSQSEMAELLGISVRAIQSYEQGWRKPPPSVQKLAGFFLFLRWQKDNPRQLSCWKIQDCSRQSREECPAFQYRAHGACWLITGNRCPKHPEINTWEAKLNYCRACPVMSDWLSGDGHADPQPAGD